MVVAADASVYVSASVPVRPPGTSVVTRSALRTEVSPLTIDEAPRTARALSTCLTLLWPSDDTFVRSRTLSLQRTLQRSRQDLASPRSLRPRRVRVSGRRLREILPRNDVTQRGCREVTVEKRRKVRCPICFDGRRAARRDFRGNDRVRSARLVPCGASIREAHGGAANGIRRAMVLVVWRARKPVQSSCAGGMTPARTSLKALGGRRNGAPRAWVVTWNVEHRPSFRVRLGSDVRQTHFFELPAL